VRLRTATNFYFYFYHFIYKGARIILYPLVLTLI
jgi:hypothetical protein